VRGPHFPEAPTTFRDASSEKEQSKMAHTCDTVGAERVEDLRGADTNGCRGESGEVRRG
jgi:hypothetical protein